MSLEPIVPPEPQTADQPQGQEPQTASEPSNQISTELRQELLRYGLVDSQITNLEHEGATSREDVARLNADQLKAITGCGLITAMKVEEAFAPAAPVATAVEPTSVVSYQSILPQLPDDTSFLEMLKQGGVLKVDRTNVIAAMRAAIASNVGLYDLPDRIMDRMEQFALEQDEPVGESFFRLQRQITERRYGDVLAAIGASGAFVNERRKKDTLSRLNTLLWPELRSFNSQLKSWVDVWSQGAANPAALMALVLGGRGVMPPGLLQPPDSSMIRDSGEAVINSINKVFAGVGIPVARALAYDAMRIREILEDSSLPSAVGAATRDQMLKTLGVDVGSDFIRLERNVTQFALAIMELPKVPAGNEELSYMGAMYSLGATIPWDKLGTGVGLANKLPSRPPRREPVSVVGDDFRDSHVSRWETPKDR